MYQVSINLLNSEIQFEVSHDERSIFSAGADVKIGRAVLMGLGWKVNCYLKRIMRSYVFNIFKCVI